MSDSIPPASDSSSPPPPRDMMRLDDFLKRCGMAGTGGQAKFWIQAGDVSLNGVVETRRRKQLVIGDVVELLGETFTLGEEHFRGPDEV